MKIQNPLALLILLAFITLAVIYSLVTPPFEAGDESRHYAVVKYMVDTGRLPVQEPGEAQTHWSHEGNQPPLYYALAAVLTFWIETGDWDDVYWYNPHTTIGNPLRPDNKNITIHPPDETWPWRGHVLAVHLIRFLSIIMASVTIMAGYFIALSLFRGNRWLAAGAMALTAFNPMFLFISASVNNDNAVIMFVSLALWLMVRMANQRASELASQPPAHHHASLKIQKSIFNLSPLKLSLLLGLLIGLGALSKLYALGLLPPAGLLLLWLAYQNDRRPATGDRGSTTINTNSYFAHQSQSPPTNAPRTTHHAPRFTFHVSRFTFHALTWNLILLAVVVAVAGWFYVRNVMLYDGDFLALQTMRETAGQRHQAPSLATLWAEFEGFRIAYWALFGGVNILVHNWIYRLLDVISLIAALGVIIFITSWLTPHVSRFTFHLSRISLPTFAILLSWYLIMMAGFIAWNLTQPAGQGRLLYPAIAAISALGMLGLTWWLSARGQQLVAGGCGLGLLIFAALAPFLHIAPAYAKPPLLAEADLPPDLQPVDFIYDGKIRLIGYQLHQTTVHPAETLPLTLYWQLLAPVDLNYSLFIHLLGRQRQVVGQLDSYPGGGRWPTTLLPPGAILADSYEVPITPEAELSGAPARLLVAVGVYDFWEPDRPGRPATTANGEPVEPIIASAKLIPWQWPAPPQLDPPINFSDQIALLSFELAPDQQTLTLNWQAIAFLDVDYTVFIQAWRFDPLPDPPPGRGRGEDGIAPSGEREEDGTTPSREKGEDVTAPSREGGEGGTTLSGEREEDATAPFGEGGEDGTAPSGEGGEDGTTLSGEREEDAMAPSREGGEYVTGFDGPPVQNDYPTSLWAPGEVIVDQHALDLNALPVGDYYLLAGLYNPITGERLPAFGPAGPLPDYAINVGTLRVTR